MPNNPGGGQGNESVAPGAGAGNQSKGGGADPTKNAPPAAPAPGSGAPSGDAPSQNAQHADTSIKIGDNVFTAADIAAALNAKKGLEDTNKSLKDKLEEIEQKDLDEKTKAEKRAEKAEKENEALKAQLLNSKIQAKLDEKGVAIKADIWNHGITDDRKIDEAVQKLINENPGIVRTDGRPAPGSGQRPPGGPAPPTETPGAGDVEREIMQRYEQAKTPEEFRKLDEEYYTLRGVRPPGGEQPI